MQPRILTIVSGYVEYGINVYAEYISLAKCLTISVKTLVQNILYGILRGFQRVLSPRLPVVAAQDCNFSLFSSQGCKVRDLNYDWPVKHRTALGIDCKHVYSSDDFHSIL